MQLIGRFSAVIAVSNSLDVQSRTIPPVNGVSVDHAAEATIYVNRRGKMRVLIPFEFTLVPLANNLEPEIPARSRIPYSGSISSQSTNGQYYPSSYYPKYQPFSSSSSTDYTSNSNYASSYPYNTAQRAEQHSILTTKPHQYPYYAQNSNPSYPSSLYYPSQSSYSSPYSSYSSSYPYDSIINRQQVIPGYPRQVGKYLN